MSQQKQLMSDLKSSREAAKSALHEFFVKLSKCTDASKKSSLSYNGIYAICMAIKGNGQHYELYFKAVEKLVATITDEHWNMFVELLRHILGELYSKNLFEWTASLAVLVEADRISTPADVKSHLKLYSRQLYYGHLHMSEKEIKEIFRLLEGLLAKCKKIGFEDLLDDFHTHIMCFPVIVQNVFSKNLDLATSVFNRFFEAVAALQIQQDKQCQAHLFLTKFLVQFVQLDITHKLTVLSQNFLRACKENQSLNKYQSYAFNLFYYLIKLLLFPNLSDFNKMFTEAVGKFSTFFDRTQLVSEPWFMDTVVTLTRVLDAYKSNPPLIQFLKEENYVDLSTLIGKLLKLSHGISYESGLWTCCNSVRKHVIYKLCMVQLLLFEAVVEQGFNEINLSSNVCLIVKHAVQVADYFKCSTVTYEVSLIMHSLTRCAFNVKTKQHALLLANLFAYMNTAKAHFPENGAKTLAKSLMLVHKVTGNLQCQIESCALYIAHLVKSNADTDLIRKYMKIFYSFEPTYSILQTLDGCTSPLKPDGFNRRLLHSLEVSVFFKTGHDNTAALTSLLKVAETPLDFVLIARQSPPEVYSIFSTKLERKYNELKSKQSLTPVEELVLGHMCKIRAVQQMDGLKNLFKVPKISDDTLSKIMEPSKLKLMDIKCEMQIMKMAMEGVESFGKFFEVAATQSFADSDFFVDWEAIIDDLSKLARWFHFRGFVDYAYKSWRLLLRITTHLNDILNQIRSMSFMCEECLFIALYDPEFDLEGEIAKIQQPIMECLENMEFLTPRKQNYVLLCLCNIGWYLAQKNCFQESQLMLDLALCKVEELVERKNKFELVRATHLAVNFRIKWKLQKCLSKRMSFQLLDKILDEVRAVVYYTSEDTLNFPILLYAVVNDISEFTTNRLSEPSTLPYVQMVLKVALDTGSAFRSIQFLTLWTHINLQSENMANCQIKLDLIDILFRNAQPEKTTLEANLNTKLKDVIKSEPIDSFRYDGEAVRKVAYVNPVSPVQIKFKAPTFHRDLQTFIIKHERDCACDKCSHEFLNWQLFKVGCLNARFLYLGDAYNETELFYTKAIKWCASTLHKSYTKFHFREFELSMLVQYVNVLRRMGNFKLALNICETSLDVYKRLQLTLDGVYHVNLSLQAESTTAVMQTKTAKLKPSTRRLLKFSPTETKPKEAHPVVAKRKGRTKKESPKTARENIEKIIYKDPIVTPPVEKSNAKDVKSARQKAKNIEKEIDKMCKSVEQVQLTDAVIKKRSRIDVRPVLNAPIIITDEDDESPENKKTLNIPKSACKVECTPKTRPKRVVPASVGAAAKSANVETRSKLLLRRRI